MQRTSPVLPSNDSCGCGCDAIDLSGLNTFVAGEAHMDRSCNEPLLPCGCPLATAYFVSQDYETAFCPEHALQSGTMFSELLKPWTKGD